MATESVQEQTVQNQVIDQNGINQGETDQAISQDEIGPTETGQSTQGDGLGDELTEVSLGHSLQRIATVIVALVVATVITAWGIYAVHPSDPYVDSVLQMSGDAPRGREIFKLNCATCHGLEAAGEVGPDLRAVSERRSRAALIQQVTSGQTPPMPQFQPGEKDMADLLSFLETL